MDRYDIYLEQIRQSFPSEMEGFDNAVMLLADAIKSVQSSLGKAMSEKAMESYVTSHSMRELMMQMNVMTSILDDVLSLAPEPFKSEVTSEVPVLTPQTVQRMKYGIKGALPDPILDASVEVRREHGQALLDQSREISFQELYEASEAPVYASQVSHTFTPAQTKETTVITQFNFMGNSYEFSTYADMIYTVIACLFRHDPNVVVSYVQRLSPDSRFYHVLSYDTAGMKSAFAIGQGIFLVVPESYGRKESLDMIYDILDRSGISRDVLELTEVSQ